MVLVRTISQLESVVCFRCQSVGRTFLRQISKTSIHLSRYVPPNESLSLSPLLDDRFYKARENYLQSKSDLSSSPTPMQRAIRKNIYARALATPVRKCTLTGVKLPRFFLLDFTPISNPTISDSGTHVPWYMPRTLTSKSPVNKTFNSTEKACLDESPVPSSNVNTSSQSCQSISEMTPVINTCSNNRNSDSRTLSKYNPPTNPDDPTTTTTVTEYHNKLEKFSNSTARIGGGVYLLRSYDALNTALSKSKKSSRSGLLSVPFLTQNLRDNPFALKTYHTARFRADMADFVLKLKRRRVMEALIFVTRKFRGYISMFIPHKSLKTCQVAAVLILGPPLVDTKLNMATEKEFYESKQKNLEDIPVFDLRNLLGEDTLKELKISDMNRWNSEALTIKNRNYCQPLLKRLWELEGYLTPLLK